MPEPSVFENRLLLQMLSGAGAAIGGQGSFAAGINPMVQQNIQAQSQVVLQNKRMKLMAKLFGKGVDVTSDKEGKVTVKGDDIKTMSDLLGGTESSESIYGEGSESIRSGSSESTAPAPAPERFSTEEIVTALGPQTVR